MTKVKRTKLPPENYDKVLLLQDERIKRGLSISELSEMTGVAQISLRAYEQQIKYPTLENFKKLADFFGWKVKPRKPEKKSSLLSELFFEVKPIEIPKNPEFNFSSGRTYEFRNKGSNIATLFKYVEKRGRHHVFQDVLGGWETTFTDAQLVGKKFTEAKNVPIK